MQSHARRTLCDYGWRTILMGLTNLRGLLCLLCLACAGAARLKAQCTPRAVLIGVSVYKDTSFTVIPHAREDALAFRDWFQTNATCGSRGQGGGKGVVSILTDEQATQSAIIRELSSVLLTAGRDDE